MEKGRTSLVPRLQQDAYMHDLAAAQPGSAADQGFSGLGLPKIQDSVHAFLDHSNYEPGVATAIDGCGAQLASTPSFPGGYLRFPSQSVGNHTFISNYNNDSYVPYNDINNSGQGPPAVGIPNEHLSDSVGSHTFINDYDNNSYAPYNNINNSGQGRPAVGIPYEHFAAPLIESDPLRYNANVSLAAQPPAFGTNSFGSIGPAHAESGTGAPPPAHWRYANAWNYNEHPFASGAASISTSTFPTGSTDYANGSFFANNPFPMLDSNSSFAPMDAEPGVGGPIALSPKYQAPGRVIANSPSPMPMFNSPLVPADVTPPGPQRPGCPVCNETFSRRSDLERHAKKHQEGSNTFKCPIEGCNRGFYRKDKLNDHVKCHTRRRHPAGGSRLN